MKTGQADNERGASRQQASGASRQRYRAEKRGVVVREDAIQWTLYFPTVFD